MADTVIAIRDEATVLMALLEIKDWRDDQEYAADILRQIQGLKEVIELFQQNAPFEEIAKYEDRMNVTRLERTVIQEMKVIEKEVGWLSRPTVHVIQNARNDLGEMALKIATAASTVYWGFGYDPPLLAEEEIQRRIRRP